MTLGITIVLVLVAALVGPMFVNWTDHRATFEAYAERVLGHRVTVLGDADLSILPAPSISFSDVRVGEAEDPLLVVSRFNMRVELPSLLKGEIRVLDMQLERPHLNLALDEGGRVDWLTAMSSHGALADMQPDDVVFDQISVRDGALTIVDARSGGTHSIDNGNFQISARTLAGPFRLDGSMTVNGDPYTLQLATGRAGAETGLRVSGDMVPSTVPVSVGFEGLLTQDDAAPSFEGTFDIATIDLEDYVTLPWQAEGAFKADISSVSFPEFDFRYGPEDRRLSMSGSAGLVFTGEQRFEIEGRAKQVDLDRFLGGGPSEAVSLDTAGSSLLEALRSVPVPPIKGEISVDVPALVAAGGIVQDVRLDLETRLGGWRIARLAGRAPGRTTIATQGDLGLEPAVTYRGALSIQSEQPTGFVEWWRQEERSTAALGAFSLDGHLNWQPEGAAFDNLQVSMGDSVARGAMSYRVPRNGKPVFSMSLDAQTLNLDQLQALTGLIRSGSDGENAQNGSEQADVSLRVRAGKVIARGVDGEGFAMEAEYSGGDLRIDRLFAADLAGARVDVKGAVRNLLSAPSGELAGSLDASDLSGLVAVASGLLPDNALVERLERAAPVLVPAKLDAKFEAASLDDASDLDISLSGIAGGSQIEANAALDGRIDNWQNAEVSVSLSASGPDSVKLMQQLGLSVLPVDSLGPGQLAFSAVGVPSSGLDVMIDAAGGDTGGSARGFLVVAKDQPAEYDFSVEAGTGDLVPLALLAGRVLPIMSGSMPADVSFEIAGTGSEVHANSIKGNLSGTVFEGELHGDLVPAPGELNRRFTGTLAVNQADLRALSEMVFGPDQWFSAGDGTSIWPTAAFSEPLVQRTDLTLDFKADRLLIDDQNEISATQGQLRLTPLMMRLDGLKGRYARGKLEGALTVRRSGAEGAVSGRIKLEDAALRQLAWQRDGRPVADGALDVFLEIEGAGRTISSIVSGLAGGGTFAIKNGEVRGINPQAFPLVIRAVDAGLDLEDDKIAEVFSSHMAAGSLPFDAIEGTLSLVGGQLGAQNVVVDSERADVFGSAELDLNTYDLDADFSLRVDAGENAVTGAEPQVGLLFQGEAGSPQRRVDIAPFSAFLTLRAFEKEVQRVEKLQAEIMEKDRLLRELRRLEQQRERRKREAEAAALKAIEEAERAAEEEKARLEAGEEARADDISPWVPEESSTATHQPAASQPEQDPANFANRIRSIIDVETESGGSESSSLPPLEPPVLVEQRIGQ